MVRQQPSAHVPAALAAAATLSLGLWLGLLGLLRPAPAGAAGLAAAAATDHWTPIGPAGGETTSLAFDGTVAGQAWATLATGLFRSSDNGASWVPAGAAGLHDSHLQQVLVVGAMLYAGGSDGLSRSTDHGRTFQRLAAAPAGVIRLAAGTGADPAVYAASDATGLWRSDDAGDTWVPIGDGLKPFTDAPPPVVAALLVDPRRPRRLWAATGDGMYRSLDGGDHWSRLATAAALDCGVAALAIDAGNVLYAGCLASPGAAPTPPLITSHDLGATWHGAARGLGAASGVASVLAAANGVVWAGTQDAGLYSSTNGGLRWTAAGAGTVGGAIGALAQSPRQPAVLLAGGGFFNGILGAAGTGIFRSTTGGAHWSLAAAGPDATTLMGVVADALTGGRLSVLDLDGQIRFTNSGGTFWQPLDNALPPPPDFDVAQIAADSIFPRDLYALGFTVAQDPALFLHAGGPAAAWQALPLPLPCIGPLATAGGKVYVGSRELLCVSGDQGGTWNLIDVGLLGIQSVAAAPANPARLYLSGFPLPHAPAGASSVYRSDDGGSTWTGVGTGVFTERPHGMAVDPEDADLLYAAASGTGVVRSRDGGATWATVLPGNATAVWVDPRSPNTIYAAPGTPGAYSLPPPADPLVSVSDDGGATWSPLVDGLPPNIAVLDLAFDAAVPGRIYAATAGGGVFRLDRAR